MIHIKKTILTLVALLAVTTGAWAQTDVSTFVDLQMALSAGNNVKLTANISFTSFITISGTKKITIDGNGKTMSGLSTCAFIISSGNTLAIKNATIDNFDRSAGGGAIRNNGTLVLDGCTVSNNHTDGSGQGGGAIENQGTLYASNTTFSGNYSSEIGGAINNYGGSLYLSGCTFTNNYTTLSNAKFGGAIGNNSSNTLVLVNCTFSGNKYGGSNGTAGDLGVYRTPGTYTIAGCTGIAIEGATLTTYQYGTATLDYSDLSAISFTYDKSDTPIASATPVDIAWDTTAKTATLTNGMPAGNVTVSVDYFPKATADGAVTAATGVKATTDAPLVTVDATQLTGAAKMMYYASTDATAPAYDATGWTDQVPTAEKFTEAGSVNVWYYPVGTDEGVGGANATYSDGDMNATALAVTIAAAPTYDVVINTAGLSAEEAGKWSASPNTGVKKGDEVTVTYTGSRKVIGVKAEKTGPTYKKWDKDQKKLVATEIPATATKVENANGDVTWPAGTYLVEGDVDIDGYINLSGDVDLIIKDGAKLTAKNFYGGDIYSLSVYGQTNMSGELNVACSDGVAICHMTALNIHSCKVNAISSLDDCGGLFAIKNFNVYGGSVDAESTGDSNGYGIFDAPLNIYGGEVKAVGKGNSKAYSYGIMGNGVTGATVTVYGGKLWAECAGNGAINSYVTLTKGAGFTGKIETSSDGTSWTEYSGTGTPDAKYVRVGYSSAGAD